LIGRAAERGSLNYVSAALGWTAQSFYELLEDAQVLGHRGPDAATEHGAEWAQRDRGVQLNCIGQPGSGRAHLQLVGKAGAERPESAPDVNATTVLEPGDLDDLDHLSWDRPGLAILRSDPDRTQGDLLATPNRASLSRLVGMVLAEQDDEWQDGRRYFGPETMALIAAVVDHKEVSPGLLMAS